MKQRNTWPIVGVVVLVAIAVFLFLVLPRLASPPPPVAEPPDEVEVNEVEVEEVEVAEVDEELFDHGQELFAADCVVCHQATGEGVPDTFPALNNNEELESVEFVVTTIHEGRGAMPAFPQFDEEDLAGVATYIRNAWDNEFGGVTVEEVEATLE